MTPDTKLVVLDRDGVINYDADDHVKSAEEWRALPGSFAAIAELCDAGYRVVVVSNQSGIGRGLFDEVALATIDAKMLAGVAAAGGSLAGVYYCPHQPDENCTCRKPRTGLLQALARDLNIATFAGVPIIGDKASDLALARAVGARGILVRTGKGRVTEAALPHDADTSVEIYDDLGAAAAALVRDA